MFDHVSINVLDFAKSVAFYTKALAPLGFEAQYVDEAGKSAGFGPKGTPCLWIAEGKPASRGIHVAFASDARTVVTRFFEAALPSGGKDNGPPGPRPDYGATYFAAFVLDPDGNNIEVVTHAPR